MLSDALFRVVNTAGGLALDDTIWRRQVLGPDPSTSRAAARRRIAEAARARVLPDEPADYPRMSRIIATSGASAGGIG